MNDTWNGIPHIKPVINFYKDMKFIIDTIEGKSFIVSYKDVWYELNDNGGEINIHKINDPAYYAEFPTTSNKHNLNADTLMYRLLATLNGETIDYNHIEPDDTAFLLSEPVRNANEQAYHERFEAATQTLKALTEGMDKLKNQEIHGKEQLKAYEDFCIALTQDNQIMAGLRLLEMRTGESYTSA